VDASLWLEYVTDGPNATRFARAIESPNLPFAPSITVLEIRKQVCQRMTPVGCNAEP